MIKMIQKIVARVKKLVKTLTFKVIPVIMSRQWCMPNPNTFTVKPIQELLHRYIPKNHQYTIIDPFARNSKFGTVTNDINPNTSASYHMNAPEFLEMLIELKTQADIILFDPPYSPRQISECYKECGLKVSMSGYISQIRFSLL